MSFIGFELDHTPAKYAEYQKKNPDIRHGQWLMNELGTANLELYKLITNTGADCFYNDDNITTFWHTLYRAWA